jgi:subtilisin family serine protease
MPYYYRAGKKVPVTVASSARVVRASDERMTAGLSGWRTVSLSSGYTLLIDQDLFDRQFTTNRMRPDIGSLSQLILDHDRQIRREPQEETVPADDVVSFAGERAELLTFPVAVSEEGNNLLFTVGDVVAQFKLETQRPSIETYAREKGWSIQRTIAYLPNGYVLRPNTQADPFKFANELVESFGAVFAHPVFLENIPNREQAVWAEERDALPPTSAALFAQEWHLHNTGQNGATPGVDVDAQRAWQITTGSPDIVICIIDSGVQSGHDVFASAGKLVSGFDFAEGDTMPEPQGSSHGTACAAVAAAGSNAGRVVGIAPRCRIIPIRRTELANHVALAEAIAFAADHGADIISCSWGIDGKSWVLPDIVRASFQYATSKGRHGAGCPIFWAAGNGDESISSDEWASSEYTIAVAASTDEGRRAAYSDFGAEVDLCAPSSGGANGITTAINGGYTSTFGGTSAAAPLVAGVAALVLSLAPHMRWFEVRDLLQASARKIDAARGGYDQRGHSTSYGYGQVDAFAALTSIDALLEVQRATETEALAPSVETLLDYLRQSPAGKIISAYVSARRFGILKEIPRSVSFRESVGGVMRVLAEVGGKLAANQPIVIPEVSWSTIALAARTVMSLPPAAAA